MFLVDDLLTSPMKGVLWVFKEIHDAAQHELANEAETITAALSELYMKLETGRITEAEFEAQEQKLLDRLDSLQAQEEPEPPPVKKPVKQPSKSRRPRKRPRSPAKAAVI